MTAQVSYDVVLRPRQLPARSDLDLPAHQIEPGAPLGHRMLDLQPRIHLEEIEVARIPVDEEFAGAGADVADGLGGVHGHAPHLCAQLRRDDGGRRLLDDFLMPALHAALALAEPDRVAVGIREDLDLDVVRPRDGLFDVDPVVAERAESFPLRGGERAVEVFRILDQPHALPAAARRGLEHDRIPDAERVLLGRGRATLGDRLFQARHDRHAGFGRLAPRARFLAHLFHGFGRRADEGHARNGAGAGKVRVFREETVAGMDRVGAGLFGGGDDVLDHQIALARGRRTDADGLVA